MTTLFDPIQVGDLRLPNRSVTPMGVGYADTPGIWSDQQVAGWKLVSDAVHAAGGRSFDGVDVHGAHGCLLDQFLQDSTKHRLDNDAGSVENRARLLLEVSDACIAVWGAGRVGGRRQPRPQAQGCLRRRVYRE